MAEEDGSLGARLRRIHEYLVHQRVRVTFFLFIPLLLENVVRGTRPLELGAGGSIWGWVGLAVLALGLFLRSWAAGMIHKNQVLARSGPYSLTRHPLYVGSLLGATGIFILLGDPVDLAVMWAVFLLLYLPKIRLEEATQAQLFGAEWEAYKADTAMFFPKRPGSIRPGGPWRAARWLDNQEYRALATSIAVVLLLQAILRFGG